MLDQLRGISILLVLATHYLHFAWLEPLGNLGLMGVWLFFTISGFLIVTKWLREKEERGRVDLRAYAARRILRIFPLYFLVLGAYILAVPAMEPNAFRVEEFHENLPYFLTFTFNLIAHPSISTAIFYYSWSLATEEQFYALWPVVDRLLRGRMLAILGAGLMLVSYAIEIGLIGWPRFLSLPYRILTDGIMEPIIWGVILAHWMHRGSSWVWRVRPGFWLPLLGAFAFLSMRSHLNGLYYGKWANPFIQLCLVALLGGAVLLELADRSPLRNRLLKRLGQLSYGIYLFNVPVKNLVEKVVNPEATLLVAMLGLGVTFALAELSYRFFEGPILRLKARFSPAAR
ncbi:MAG: acyltransferase [Chthonomonas sp.]|nr:acyltransferase [Chthonomonas sp.]